MAIISNGTTIASGGSLSVSVAPTDAQVASAIASGASAGSVGTYVCVRTDSGTLTPNQTFSGNSNNWKYGGLNFTNIPSGTYRSLGNASSTVGNAGSQVTIAVRIS